MLALTIGASLVMFAAGLILASSLGHRPILTARYGRLTVRELVFLAMIVSLPTFMLAGEAREWLQHGMALYWPRIALALWTLPFTTTLVLCGDWVEDSDASSSLQGRVIMWACLLAASAIALAIAHWVLDAPNPLLEMAGWWAFSGVLGVVWMCRRTPLTALGKESGYPPVSR